MHLAVLVYAPPIRVRNRVLSLLVRAPRHLLDCLIMIIPLSVAKPIISF